MDWQWLNTGAARSYPDRMCRSEYFARRLYATFWSEARARAMVEDLPDNVMFESDFPHPPAWHPGRRRTSDSPRNVIEQNLGDLPETVLRKLLYENAAADLRHRSQPVPRRLTTAASPSPRRSFVRARRGSPSTAPAVT